MRTIDRPVNVSNATAIVLAGGKSSRMGRAKALLEFDGEPLISHVVAALTPLFADIVIVGAPGQELPALPVTVVRDDVAFQGPVGGLCYGLRAARGEVCFVTSCDSVFLSRPLIRDLVARIVEHDVVVPRWQGRLQPLHAVYRRSVLPLLEGQLERGELRPVYLFDRVRTLQVDEQTIRRLDPDGASFFNMNTPEDYVEALELWSASVHCTVELFGAARLLSGLREVALTLPSSATISHLLAALATEVPALSGRVVTTDGSRLTDGYACNVNGREFVRTPATPIQPGDRVMILSADAGG
jgi:molybdopterin-guanine dinucleotide biosynthesis protein A/molybdopterin converting factor small subunit